MKNTTAIVVTWNSAKIISECIQSLIDQTESLLEIVIVDNDSSDNTRVLIADEFGDVVTMLAQSSNTGFARGNNIGIKYAFNNRACDNILLLNADARLNEKWLENIQRSINGDKKIFAAQGLTLNYYDHNKVDALGILVNQHGQAVQLGFNEKRKKTYRDQEIFGVNAAAALYRRSFLDKQPFADYFDETLYMYYEDVDLAMRAQIMGGKSLMVGDALAYHMGSASKIRVKAERLMVRNAPLILLKNLPTSLLYRMFIPFSVVQARRVAGHLRKGSYRLFFASCFGVLQSAVLSFVFLAKRQKLKKYRSVKSAELWKRM